VTGPGLADDPDGAVCPTATGTWAVQDVRHPL
jgi:hypothetical protein